MDADRAGGSCSDPLIHIERLAVRTVIRHETLAPMKLTTADKRLLAKATQSPWPEDGGSSFYEFVKTPENDPAKFGIVRRVVHDDPTEIVRFAVISARQIWADFARERVRDRSPAAMWHACLWALAVNDEEAVQHFVEHLPERCPEEADGGISYYPRIYDLFFAILRGTDAGPALTQIAESPSPPSHELAIVTALRAISERSAGGFANALVECGKSLRRIRHIDPHYKLTDIIGHGLWELAFRTDVKVVSAWDTSSALPWDSGFYNWRRSGVAAIETIDRDKIDPSDLAQLEFRPLRE